MNVRNFSLVLAIAVMSVSSVSAQGDFFFSFTEGGRKTLIRLPNLMLATQALYSFTGRQMVLMTLT